MNQKKYNFPRLNSVSNINDTLILSNFLGFSVPEPINEISIEKITSTKAEFKWSPPEMNGKFVNYEITINIDGPLYPVDKTKCEINRTSITKNHKEYHFSYEDFLPFYNYSISVKACTNVGCGSEYSQTFETLSMSTY